MMIKFRVAITIALTIVGYSKSGEPAIDSTAVSSASARSAPAATVNVCDLATDAEMSTALGAAVTGKEQTKEGHCLYKTANPVIYADVEVDRQNADAAWQGVNAGDSLIGAAQDSLNGIGDKAFFGPRDRLYVRKGNAFVAVEAGFDDKVKDRARNVARLLTAKL